MVDSALLEQVLRLDVESRRELIRAVEGSLDFDDVPPHVLAEIDRRLAKLGSGLSPHAVPAYEFLRRVRARRSAPRFNQWKQHRLVGVTVAAR